jgi:hypothetical protein
VFYASNACKELVWGIVIVQIGGNLACLLLSATYRVFHIWHQVLEDITICIISNNDAVYNVLWRKMLSGAEIGIQFAVLYRPPDSYLTQF